MPFRTTNRGRTNLWVPGLLLMLALAAFWVLSSDSSIGPNQVDVPRLPNSSKQDSDSLTKGAVLEPVDLAPRPNRDALSYQPKFGVIGGRVVAANWVIWPRSITLSLTPQAGGDAIATAPASEEDPTFTFERIPFGEYTLKLTAPECLDQNLLLTLSVEQNNHFFAVAVVPAASVVGYVRDEQGEPVAHIPVAAVFRSHRPGASQVPLTASTDKDGRFRISGLRDGEFNIYVGSFRNPLSELKVIGISREAPEAYVEFTVKKMGSATVTVNFLDGPQTAQKDWRTMRVQATRTEKGLGFSESLALREDGTVVFTSLPPGDYSFSAYGGPYRKVMRSATVHVETQSFVTIPMRSLNQD